MSTKDRASVRPSSTHFSEAAELALRAGAYLAGQAPAGSGYGLATAAAATAGFVLPAPAPRSNAVAGDPHRAALRAALSTVARIAGRTLGPRQHIEIIGVEGPVLPEDALIDDKTYVISGSAAAIEVSVSVGDAPARNTELQADAATVAHALHSAGVSCEGRALTVDGRPATVADLLSEGQHVRVGEDHLVVLVEIGRFRGNVALALGSTPIDALLAAGIDAEIPGFAVRAAGSAEFEPIEPDAALSYGCVLHTAEPPAAAATPGFTEAAARIAETIEGFLNGEGIEAALVQDADAEPHDAAPEASIDPVGTWSAFSTAPWIASKPESSKPKPPRPPLPPPRPSMDWSRTAATAPPPSAGSATRPSSTC